MDNSDNKGMTMKTKAVRIHGKGDIRLEEFDLPAIRDDEIRARSEGVV